MGQTAKHSQHNLLMQLTLYCKVTSGLRCEDLLAEFVPERGDISWFGSHLVAVLMLTSGFVARRQECGYVLYFALFVSLCCALCRHPLPHAMLRLTFSHAGARMGPVFSAVLSRTIASTPLPGLQCLLLCNRGNSCSDNCIACCCFVVVGFLLGECQCCHVCPLCSHRPCQHLYRPRQYLRPDPSIAPTRALISNSIVLEAGSCYSYRHLYGGLLPTYALSGKRVLSARSTS